MRRPTIRFSACRPACGRTTARARCAPRALRNGTVWINDHNKLFAEAETGGYRQSGLGRLHGYDALADFTEIKHICMPAGIVEGVAPLR
ncbi:acyl-CoA reductase-like NAD-dependent aldehyde dehydrogenase [Paraburkholderia sp. RAU6.4a]